MPLGINYADVRSLIRLFLLRFHILHCQKRSINCVSTGENGPNFAGQSYNARVNMCISNSSWQLVVTRLTKICSTPAASVWGLASTVDAAKLMASGGGIFVA